MKRKNKKSRGKTKTTPATAADQHAEEPSSSAPEGGGGQGAAPSASSATAKKVITGALLAFVALSVVVLLARETGHDEAPSPGGEVAAVDASHRTTSDEVSTSVERTASRGAQAAAGDKNYVVSYLHGRARCGPCRTLQAYAEQAVRTHFADELAAGTMEFRIVNVATPEHGHLAQHYGIYTQSVIVSEMKDGRELRWKNLDEIWQLVRDRDAYFEYIHSEIDEFRSKS